MNQSRAAFMAGAASFLSAYADAFEADVGGDRSPGLRNPPAGDHAAGRRVNLRIDGDCRRPRVG